MLALAAMAGRSIIAVADARHAPAGTHRGSFEHERQGQPGRLSVTPPAVPCPVCASDLTRSRVRWWERAYKLWTTKRPYRCGQCRSRAWIDVAMD